MFRDGSGEDCISYTHKCISNGVWVAWEGIHPLLPPNDGFHILCGGPKELWTRPCIDTEVVRDLVHDAVGVSLSGPYGGTSGTCGKEEGNFGGLLGNVLGWTSGGSEKTRIKLQVMNTNDGEKSSYRRAGKKTSLKTRVGCDSLL